jgi:hypothetical protein
MRLRQHRPSCTAIAFILLAAGAAHAGTPAQDRFIRSVDAMMVALAPESARAGAETRRLYQEHLELLMLEAYTDVTGALDNGGLVPLPDNPREFNLVPRLEGPHPIGEKDLENQTSYVAARPATMGALIEIASRVTSGPVEVTSLVRHSHYQQELKSTNANASTSVPTHTLGLAFDIGVVNSKLKTVYEIRDVLRQMQRNGDILFIAERHQLVFHVVPHPSRLGHFTDLYARKVGAPPTSRSALVVASLPPEAARVRRPLAPRVTAEVLAVQPVGAEETWHHPQLVAGTGGDDELQPASAIGETAPRTRPLQRSVVLLVALLTIAWRLTPRPRMLRSPIFDW